MLFQTLTPRRQLWMDMPSGYNFLGNTSRPVVALRLLGLCHSIGLWPPFSALWASTLPAALISACGLNFQPFWPQLCLRL